MRLLTLVLVGLTATFAGAGEKDRVPDMTGILRLVGRFGAAHACPVGELILTNGHVTDLRPFDRDVSLMPYRYSDGAGHSGILAPVSTERCADLGLMAVRPGFTVKPYPVASEAPKVGERVWYQGFDFASRGKAYAERVVAAKVLRIVAGHLILDEVGDFGSSGSCVLNVRGQVVGINAFGHKVRSGEEVEGVVGIWGEWLGSCK